jgi:hypothetical protein
MAKYNLSPTTLNIFLECPRCFWLHINQNIRRPRPIFPSLPGGMDIVLKMYFDRYRLKNQLPPEIAGKVSGSLFPNISILERWRSWFDTNLRYEDRSLDAMLSGALDDCLIEEDSYIPLDFKTRGTGLKEDPKKYYQVQLDCYCLILEASGYKTKGISYLVYLWPTEVIEGGLIKFNVEVIKVKTNIKAAKKVFKEAAELLQLGIPEANPDCQYCNYHEQRMTRNID